jgi:hypothetical protein
MRAVMKNGEHYGVIPGTNKPTLLKPGAEKLGVTFRLVLSYEMHVIEMQNGHREYRLKCILTHAPTGQFFGEGVGSCSTMETKYRYRKAEQVCPECGKETIIKGKKEYGGGWLCFAKKGGCGAKFTDGDERIENQNMGRVEYPDPADYYNTVLKMAKKRAQVDAILTATAASDIFTQDVEDLPGQPEGKHEPPKTQPRQQSNPTYQSKQAPTPDSGALAMDVVGVAMDKCKTAVELTEYMNANSKRFTDKKLGTKLFKDRLDKIKNGAQAQAEPEQPSPTPGDEPAKVTCPKNGDRMIIDACLERCAESGTCPAIVEFNEG